MAHRHRSEPYPHAHLRLPTTMPAVPSQTAVERVKGRLVRCDDELCTDPSHPSLRPLAMTFVQWGRTSGAHDRLAFNFVLAMPSVQWISSEEAKDEPIVAERTDWASVNSGLLFASDVLPDFYVDYLHYEYEHAQWIHVPNRFDKDRKPIARGMLLYGCARKYIHSQWIEPQPMPLWTQQLQHLVTQITRLNVPRLPADFVYNSCIVNYYPDGHAGIGKHADDAPENATDMPIACVSLGVDRTLSIDGHDTLSVPLSEGSLLIMYGSFQRFFKHAIHPSRKQLGARISFTFRMCKPVL